MFVHPTCSLKIPSASSQRVADLGGHGYRARFAHISTPSLSRLKSCSRYFVLLFVLLCRFSLLTANVGVHNMYTYICCE